MTARRDPESLLQAYLEDGPTQLADRSYDAVRTEIDHKRQRVVFGPWAFPNMSNFARFAFAAAAAVLVAVIGIDFLRQNVVGPGTSPSPAPSPSPTGSPTALWGEGRPLAAGSYVVTPFLGADPGICGPTATGATPAPCEESTTDDTIRFTFALPDGWDGAPFQSIWLASEQNAAPDGASLIFVRGGWLYSEPCVTDESVELNGANPNVPVGPTVDDFANALAEHPLLDVTAPVDITLSGFAGKYADLQVPADISGCNVYYPWEGGASLFAQGPSQRWHLWILDVDGIRVVVQAMDYPGTSAEHQAELRQSLLDTDHPLASRHASASGGLRHPTGHHLRAASCCWRPIVCEFQRLLDERSFRVGVADGRPIRTRTDPDASARCASPEAASPWSRPQTR